MTAYHPQVDNQFQKNQKSTKATLVSLIQIKNKRYFILFITSCVLNVVICSLEHYLCSVLTPMYDNIWNRFIYPLIFIFY